MEYSGTPYEPGENVAPSDPTVPEIPVVDSIPIQPANSGCQDSLVVIKCTHSDCARTFRDKNTYTHHQFYHRHDVVKWTTPHHANDHNIFRASNGWLQRMSDRYDIKSRIMYGEKGSADEPAAIKFVEEFSHTPDTDFQYLT